MELMLRRPKNKVNVWSRDGSKNCYGLLGVPGEGTGAEGAERNVMR